MNRVTLVFVFVLYTSLVFSQSFDSIAYKYANQIDASGIEKHLNVIASDEYEGRETGKKGQKMAMDYLINQFKSFGIEDYSGLNYRQSFVLVEQQNEGIEVQMNDKKFELHKDFKMSPSILADTSFNTKVVFIGNGTEEEYKAIESNLEAVFLYIDDTTNNWNLRKAITLAKEKGASSIFYWDENFEKNSKKFEHYYKKPRMTLKENVVFKALTISTSENFFFSYLKSIDYTYKKLQKKGSKKLLGSSVSFSIKIDKPTEELTSENVLAYIPGTEKKEELIVLTAHYDHIGMEDTLIFNGADDDGTGTVSLIEIAESFMNAKKDGHYLKRSILIMPVSGEEKGLLGSKYYTDNPIFPLENTVANLNIDMIGRYDKKHESDSNYIYLIGSDRLSKDLHDVSEMVNATYCNINLDYTFNEEGDPNRFYYRSDHYNFAKNNIPVIFYFSGVHEDYHKSTDTVEKIDFEKTARVARLVFLTAWELANREERIKLIE
jgi:hypothetical protein